MEDTTEYNRAAFYRTTAKCLGKLTVADLFGSSSKVENNKTFSLRLRYKHSSILYLHQRSWCQRSKTLVDLKTVPLESVRWDLKVLPYCQSNFQGCVSQACVVSDMLAILCRMPGEGDINHFLRRNSHSTLGARSPFFFSPSVLMVTSLLSQSYFTLG